MSWIEKYKLKLIALKRATTERNFGLILDGEQRYIEHINNKVQTAFFSIKIPALMMNYRERNRYRGYKTPEYALVMVFTKGKYYPL